MFPRNSIYLCDGATLATCTLVDILQSCKCIAPAHHTIKPPGVSPALQLGVRNTFLMAHFHCPSFRVLVIRDKKMADKLMLIPIDDTQNNRFCRLKRLNTQLNKPINQNLLRSPKLLSQPANKKTLSEDFED